MWLLQRQKVLKALVLPILLAGFVLSNPLAWAGQGEGLHLLEANECGVVVELVMPELEVEEAGDTYVRLKSPPGFAMTAEPGRPSLPVAGALLGVPTAGPVSLHILADEVATRYLPKPLEPLGLPTLPDEAPNPQPPTPNPQSPISDLQFPISTIPSPPDPTVYDRNAFFPNAVATVEEAGFIRDQRVAHLRLHPVQYNPFTGELLIHRGLRVQVEFGPAENLVMNHQVERTKPATCPRQREAGYSSRAIHRPLPVQPDDLSSGNPLGASPFDQVLRNVLLNGSSLPAVARRPLGRIPAAPPPVPPTPALKVFVEADGLYELTYDDLVSVGLDPDALDPHRLRLMAGGEAVSIIVSGEEDGHFDPGDTIHFYGVAMTGTYTTRNVYWLSWSDEPGPRVSVRDGTPTGQAPIASRFWKTVHLEENHEYYQDLNTGQGLPDGAGQDHWFWERLTVVSAEPVTATYTLTLTALAVTDDTAKLRVSLRGRTDVPAVNPDHHTRVYLNGHLVSDAWWDGHALFEHQEIFPQWLLREGPNTVQVVSVGDTGASVDSIFVNYVELDHWARFVADDDKLLFSAPDGGPFEFQITGLTSPDVEVFDITDPLAPVAITPRVEPVPDGYVARFEDPLGPAGRRYLVVGEGGRRRPAGLELDAPSAWATPDHGADYIVITHPDFRDALGPLIAHRRAQGRRVSVVAVNDIYDEFSYGVFDPRAIRDFLSYAYHHWQPPAPTYVLLVGDASYDYRDYLGQGMGNWVPAYLVETPIFGEAPADNWFVAVSGDDPLPDMFIGRITARSPADVSAVVTKVIRYEKLARRGTWTRQALFVADDNDIAFEWVSDRLAGLLPPTVQPVKVYARLYEPPANPRTEIFEEMNRGTLLANYVGHGNITIWGRWQGELMFWTDYLPDLENTDRYPFVTVSNCLNGFFVHPTTHLSLGEALVNASDRGAIATWSPAGLGYLWQEWSLMEQLFRALFVDDVRPLGAATTQAKLSAYAQDPGLEDLVQTFVLLGDPATELAVPAEEWRAFLPLVQRLHEKLR